MESIYSLAGFAVYIFFRWAAQSNRKTSGKSRKKWKRWIFEEKEEWLATFFGAIAFMFMGDGLIISTCKLIGNFNIIPLELAIDIYIDNEIFFYIMGGATFGTVFLLLIKKVFNTAEKRAKE